MKYIFNRINEHIENDFELAIPQGFSSTAAIRHKGFLGFRTLSPASSFVSVDNEALRNPLLGIAATVRPILP